MELWHYRRIVIVEITYKIRTPFKTLISKKATTWQLKKAQNSDKILGKTMPSIYHILLSGGSRDYA